jgi:hypothetical protein
MTKANALQAALSASSGKTRPATPAQEGQWAKEGAGQKPEPVKAATRGNKVNISGYLSPEYRRGLRLVQAVTDKNLETLMAEAYNDLFAKYNVPQVRED